MGKKNTGYIFICRIYDQDTTLETPCKYIIYYNVCIKSRKFKISYIFYIQFLLYLFLVVFFLYKNKIVKKKLFSTSTLVIGEYLNLSKTARSISTTTSCVLLSTVDMLKRLMQFFFNYLANRSRNGICESLKAPNQFLALELCTLSL